MRAARPLTWVQALAPRGVPVARRVVAAGFQVPFGRPLRETSSVPGDPGLFGPGSASWALLRDVHVAVTGVRALLVQSLHPVALAGVLDHGTFAEDFLGRVRRTARYVAGVNLGDTATALALSRHARRFHDRVHGVTEEGVPYDAHDPHLLIWVGLTFTESMLAAAEQLGPRPVPRALADRFVAEQAVANALLDRRVDLDALAADEDTLAALRRGEPVLPLLAEGRLPTDRAGLHAALAAYLPELRLTARGRKAVDYLLRPRIPRGQRAAYQPLLAAVLQTLPPEWRAIVDAGRPPLLDKLLTAGGIALLDTAALLNGPPEPWRQARARMAGAGSGSPQVRARSTASASAAASLP